MKLLLLVLYLDAKLEMQVLVELVIYFHVFGMDLPVPLEFVQPGKIVHLVLLTQLLVILVMIVQLLVVLSKV